MVKNIIIGNQVINFFSGFWTKDYRMFLKSMVKNVNINDTDSGMIIIQVNIGVNVCRNT